MPYIVNFTDSENKRPITVFDNTSSTDTSLTFPGRNVTGYGQIIAENFLSLLENFASPSTMPPEAPVEGQLWYNATDGILQIWDNTNWKAASNIQKSASAPDEAAAKVGELWVDTTNQQLRIFSGTRWILVGPSESSVDGLQYGPVIERIADSDNTTRTILSFYIADVPVIIFSKDSFTPKITLPGFSDIKSGINVNAPSTTDAANFLGGLLPKLYGTAESADSLNVPGVVDPVPSTKFLRSNVVNTTEQPFNIRNNGGLTLGVDGTFELSNSTTAARIYNKSTGSSIDLQTNRNGLASTIVRIIDNKVGINSLAPNYSLDVDGTIGTNGVLYINNTTESTNLGNGSIVTTGGIAVTKNILVGSTLDVVGTTTVTSILPRVTDAYDSGSSTKKWKTIWAKTVRADEIVGVLNGNISGNANTATNLQNTTSFTLNGDVISDTVEFDGAKGSFTKVFNTQLSANIIRSKEEPFPAISKTTDYVLTYRPSESTSTSQGLLKQTRDTFVGDLGVPIGAVIPFAGTIAPYGYLLCDGSEVERAKYGALYDVINTLYNGPTALVGFNTFRLPDMRGRFPLGRDNMDNGGTVPLSSGSYVDAGGGAAGRVPDTKAQVVGGDAGQSSTTISLSNLPDHTHTMQQNGQQYAAILIDTSINPPAKPGLGPTAPGQAQYLESTGFVTPPSGAIGFSFGSALGIMNPYLTVNYIIRSGPPAFTTTTV